MERPEGKPVADPRSGSFPLEKGSLYVVYGQTGFRMTKRRHGFESVVVVEEVVVLPHLEAEEGLREMV